MMHDDASAALPPLDQRVLELSTLVWQWEHDARPHVVAEHGGGPDPIGAYVAGPRTRVALDAGGVARGRSRLFVYTPAERVTVRYTRRTLVGVVDLYALQMEERGAVAGVHGGFDDPDAFGTLGPKLRLHRAGAAAFAETLPPLAHAPRRREPRRGPGPPYDFYADDWMENAGGPAGVGREAINVEAPELPGQGENDMRVFGEAEECDAVQFLGWGGPWVATLLERQASGDMGTRTEVKWFADGNDEDEANWGVELEFQPVDLEKSWMDNEDGVVHLQGYTVDATVKRVFVNAQWFKRDQREQEPEDDGVWAARRIRLWVGSTV